MDRDRCDSGRIGIIKRIRKGCLFDSLLILIIFGKVAFGDDEDAAQIDENADAE